MEQLLRDIELQYSRLIPATLSAAQLTERLYGVFVGYHAWNAEPEDHAEMGMELSLLLESRRNQIFEEHRDPNEASYYAYSSSEFYPVPNVRIESEELRRNLLTWYSYQQSDQFGLYNAKVLDQIGRTLTSACRILNRQDWPTDHFTEDFIVFSECMSDDPSQFGLKQCLSEE